MDPHERMQESEETLESRALAALRWIGERTREATGGKDSVCDAALRDIEAQCEEVLEEAARVAGDPFLDDCAAQPAADEAAYCREVGEGLKG